MQTRMVIDVLQNLHSISQVIGAEAIGTIDKEKTIKERECDSWVFLGGGQRSAEMGVIQIWNQ